MTRKDYIKLAQAMAESRPRPGDRKYTNNHRDDRARRAQWEHDCSKLSDALASDNSRFDPIRFLTACGYFQT